MVSQGFQAEKAAGIAQRQEPGRRNKKKVFFSFCLHPALVVALNTLPVWGVIG